MKKKTVRVVAYIIITLSILTYFFLNNSYQKIDIFNAKGFNKETENPIKSIADKRTLMEFSTILITSSRMGGILDVAQPKYVLELHANNNRIKTIYLWIDNNSINGMYMYKNKTETGYSISKKNTIKLKQILVSAGSQ